AEARITDVAGKIGRNHELAQQLGATGVFEARAIAAMIDEPDKVTRLQIESWARGLDSWAICDACCCYLFRKTPFAWEKASSWASHESEFVKRAGLALMAYLDVNEYTAKRRQFMSHLPHITALA